MGYSESAGESCGVARPGRPVGEDTVRIVHTPRAVVGRAVARTLGPRPRDPDSGDRTDEPAGRLRRQLGHDMRHEVATIMLLASLLDAAPDVGPDSRQRARQLLGEARWLEELQRAYEDTLAARADLTRSVPEPIRLDLIAREVVAATRLSTQTTIDLYADEAWAYTDRLAFWRTLRNMIGNAVRAAGPRGRVGVGVASAAGWAIIQVDDDGPGFGSVEPGMESLGLEIVREFADRWSGNLEIRRGPLGGCRVGLRMRAASAGRACSAWGEFDAIADL